MPDFILGTESEHIRVSWSSSLKGDAWGETQVDIAVRSFHGAITPMVEGVDLLNFAKELRALYDSLKGVAELSTRERQIGFKVTAGSGGHVLLAGEAWSEATCGNCLRFELELDQSYLSEPLNVLERWANALNMTPVSGHS